MADPSTTTDSSTTKNLPNETTTTSRLLYLRSDQANIHLSPTEKQWMIPPILANPGVLHRLNIRSLRIYHLFPSVRTAKTLKILDHDAIEIYPANWDALSLANYLSAMLDDVVVVFDMTDLQFHFEPAITIESETTCQKYLGLHPDFVGTITKSQFPANLTLPQSIYVYTNLSAQTIPPSGLLGIVPINVGFGELIVYDNTSADSSILCMDHQIRDITIRLTNENGQPLCPNVAEDGGYDINDDYLPPWEIGLTIEVSDHPGIGSLERALDLATVIDPQ